MWLLCGCCEVVMWLLVSCFVIVVWLFCDCGVALAGGVVVWLCTNSCGVLLLVVV